MMKRRFACCLLAAVMLLAILSGCTKAPEDTSTGASEGRGDDYFRNMAVSAVDDVIKNWWDGDAAAGTGHIKFASHGFHEEGMTVSGTCPWETSMIYACIYDMWFLTGDEYYKNLLLSEAAVYRELDEKTLEYASGNYNWASDDCSWNAIMYLSFYNMTQDSWFLDRAIGLLDSVMERWYNEEKDFLYYKDDVD